MAVWAQRSKVHGSTAAAPPPLCRIQTDRIATEYKADLKTVTVWWFSSSYKQIRLGLLIFVWIFQSSRLWIRLNRLVRSGLGPQNLWIIGCGRLILRWVPLEVEWEEAEEQRERFFGSGTGFSLSTSRRFSWTPRVSERLNLSTYFSTYLFYFLSFLVVFRFLYQSNGLCHTITKGFRTWVTVTSLGDDT